MKKTISLLLFLSLFLGTACSSFSNTQVSDLVTPGLGLAGGAAGMYAGKDESTGTQMAYGAGGALAGYLAGMFITNGFKEEKAKEFRTGYDLGRSNATKELYWCTQELHRSQEQNPKVVYYQIPHIYHADGINRVPSSALIPIVTPK